MFPWICHEGEKLPCKLGLLELGTCPRTFWLDQYGRAFLPQGNEVATSIKSTGVLTQTPRGCRRRQVRSLRSAALTRWDPVNFGI